ncbi:GTP pyrophosphokinase rsh [Alphaproteobacteria bacterium]
MIVTETKERLLCFIKDNLPHIDIKVVEKAIDFAILAHAGQKRASGGAYVTHPLEVGILVAELKLDTTSIVSALLHDIVEDTQYTLEDIKREFGEKEAEIIKGLTKLSEIENKSKSTKHADNICKLLLAVSQDIRVLLVKLADRLHNTRTLSYMKNPEKRRQKALETMEIYAPLAERIGLQRLKNELQDLTFAELYPTIRQSIVNRLHFLRKHSELAIKNIINELQELLNQSGLDATVSGREKTPYSIWQKMEHKRLTFEQLADIFAFRIITGSVAECYQVLGLVHIKYHMIPNGLQDYISTQKANGYRSLHTIVIGPDKKPMEIQIRTAEMHEVAELGIAAHWAYKQGFFFDNLVHHKWLKKLKEVLESSISPEEFVKNAKLEMYYDQVFCFSPKGDLVALPKNATPIDFAFAIHSTVGLTCVGVRVNGKITPLNTQLQNGDQVEILRSDMLRIPDNWEQAVVTGKAKAIIRKFIKNKRKNALISLGKTVLIQRLQSIEQEYDENKVSSTLLLFQKSSVDDLLASIGEGTIDADLVLNALFSPKKTLFGQIAKYFSFLKKKKKRIFDRKTGNLVDIRGMVQGMGFHLAKCCGPLPGEAIVGIMIPQKGVEVHTVDCKVINSKDPHKFVELSWRDSDVQTYVSKIRIVIANGVNSIAAVTQFLAQNKINIFNFAISKRSIDFFELTVEIEVHGAEHLSIITSSLQSLEHVYNIEKIR